MTEDFSARVAAAYDGAAATYARVWAPVLLPVSTRLVAPLPLDSARVVVDAAAGTGGLLPTLRSLAPAATVVGLDLSAGMLRFASGPRAQADCTALPLRTAVADAVVFAFVLFHVPGRDRALAGAARVLRPGGWVATATWAAGAGSPYDEVFVAELDAAGAAPVPPLRDDAGLDSPDGITALLEAAGFVDVETETARIDYAPTADDYLAYRVAGGPFRTRWLSLEPAARDAVLESARARLTALPEAARVDRSPAVLARARRP